MEENGVFTPKLI